MNFSLTIGSLKFNAKSIGIILFSFLLMGVLAGLDSAIHIDNPDLSSAIPSPILWAFSIPMILLVKGIRKVEELNPIPAE